MNTKFQQIQSYEDLKRQATTVGMLLSAIRVGQEVPGRDRFLTVGLEVCDIVRERGRLGERPSSPTYEDEAFMDRFSRPRSETALDYPAKLETLTEQAITVRTVLERLLHLEQVPAEDVALSCNFYHLVYDAF